MPKNPDGSYIIDWSITFNQSWEEMEKLLETGKVKAIGISNFSVKKYVRGSSPHWRINMFGVVLRYF